ncbi:MAG TPA: O-acetyl-ADP-ribose deacetylase [Bryobacteraceae bacterium]|nr:O-acetyl-ADP-ribose deacetylase [Bryobacteraceae bacterium]
MELEFPRGRKLRLVKGDITRIAVDAIVNAANSALRGGGGVDGAIHRAGGPAIMKELDEIRRNSGSCPTGSAVVTTAGALPAEWVFHAVGPVYRDGNHDEPGLLRSCYETCLRLAEERGVRTISFPAISTGIYGYPMRKAAEIAIEAAGEHLLAENTGVREVILVLAGEDAYRHHAAALSARFGERLE